MASLKPATKGHTRRPRVPPPTPMPGLFSRLVLGPARVGAYAAAYFGFGMLAIWIFLASAFVWPVAPALAYELNSGTAFLLWYYMQKVFEKDRRALVTLSGDIVPEGENAIVLANHMSFSDFYLINALALRKGMLPYCRWFAKAELIWRLPIFGLCMWLMGMVMVKRNWLSDAASTHEAFVDLKRPEGKGKKVWLITFLEGTRKTPKKLLESQRFSEKRGKPVLKNLLFPRTKGFVAAVQELRGSQVTHVYDLTLMYTSPLDARSKGTRFGYPASLWTVHALPTLPFTTYGYHVHVRRWALADLPKSEADIAAWAEARWVEKDAIIEGARKDFEAKRLIQSSRGGGESAEGMWIGWQGLVQPSGGVYRDDFWSKSG